MSGELKIDSEYIILAGSDVIKIKVLDVTATSIKVHNLDDDFIKRYLLEDYKLRVIEEVSKPTGDLKLKEDSDKKALLNAFAEHTGKVVIPIKFDKESFNNTFTKHLQENEDTILQTNALGKSNAERLAEILAATSQKEVEELVKDDKEIWKEIPNMGQPYLLSNKGRVKSAYGKILKPYKRGDGSLWVQLKRLKVPGHEHLNVNILLERIFGLKKV